MTQPASVSRWGLLWRSKNRLDGECSHIIFHDYLPALFRTRAAARAFAREHYGYIRRCPYLRAEPHGWRMPEPVRVKLTASVDTRRMAETGTGSGRSPSGAVPAEQGDAQPSPPSSPENPT